MPAPQHPCILRSWRANRQSGRLPPFAGGTDSARGRPASQSPGPDLVFCIRERTMSDELTVRSGHVVALRVCDVANEIGLRGAEDIWGRRAQGASARSRLAGSPPRAVSLGVPPLALELGAVTLDLVSDTVGHSRHAPV